MRFAACVLTVAFSLSVSAPQALAQTRHVASPSALDAAIQAHVDERQADRDLVERLLQRPDVRKVASGAGIDLRTASDAVRTMDDRTLAAVAVQAQATERALAGGQSTVTISTTAIIIGLLILILILVAD
jgi:hypothetical protein